jgi:SAM-dependent methyltransferase
VTPPPRSGGLPEPADAYGRILSDAFAGQEVCEIVERDDGMIWGGDPSDYFAPFRRWPATERRMMRFARGRVLDAGCGAGRVSLHLQGRGLDVVAIDESPLAVDVARRRGVLSCEVASVTALPERLGVFDTVVIARNNFGLGDERDGGRGRLLAELAARTSPRGRIITDSVDPARMPADRRPAHDHRYRIRWLDCTSPWFRYEMFAPDEAADVVAGTGWRVARVLDDGSPRWGMVLEKLA